MKIIYTVLFLVAFASFSWGQQIKIVALNQPEEALNGQTIEVSGDPTDALIYQEFRIINQTGNALDFYYRRKRLIDGGVLDQICDDFLCHDLPNQTDVTTPVPNTTQPGDSALFKPQIVPGGETFCAIHEYYVVSQFGTIYDSVRVKFSAGDVNCVLTVKEEQEVNFTMYPNPTSNQLTVNFNAFEKREIVIKDALGKTVVKQFVTSGETISLAQLHNGLYFVSFVGANGQLAVTQKLIVKQD